MAVAKLSLKKAVAAKCGMTHEAALDAIEAAFGAIKEAMENGQSVQIRGFGTFSPKDMAGRTYVLQGLTRTTKAHKRVSFKPLFKI